MAQLPPLPPWWQNPARRPANRGHPAPTRIISTLTPPAMPTARYSPGDIMGLGPAVPMSPPPQLSRSAPPGQTQLMFKWAEPKICSEELPQATKLPPSGVKTRCPPCNPGFAKSNGSACQPCPYGSYSNGSGKDVPSISGGDNACAHSANTRVHVYIVQIYACRCSADTFMQI